MNATLKWTKFEAIMTAVNAVKGISALIFNSFENNHISDLENS
jgi:hypothetical protein